MRNKYLNLVKFIVGTSIGLLLNTSCVSYHHNQLTMQDGVRCPEKLKVVESESENALPQRRPASYSVKPNQETCRELFSE